MAGFAVAVLALREMEEFDMIAESIDRSLLRRSLFLKDQKCHWCGVDTFMVVSEIKGASIDHIFHVWDIRRYEQGGLAVVLACEGCNRKRNQMVQKAIPKQLFQTFRGLTNVEIAQLLKKKRVDIPCGPPKLPALRPRPREGAMKRRKYVNNPISNPAWNDDVPADETEKLIVKIRAYYGKKRLDEPNGVP